MTARAINANAKAAAKPSCTIPLAWLPPVLATVVCALSLSVWEHGTNGTAEMFDLLMFAYVVRSLLEFRLDENPNRLYRAAFVFGAAMTNNLAMIAFFPLFIVAWSGRGSWLSSI
jgi:hypothetical protein